MRIKNDQQEHATEVFRAYFKAGALRLTELS
jgi:hypothetical protein